MSNQAIGVSTLMAAMILGSSAATAVNYVRNSHFEELEISVRVDYGEAIELEAISERGLRLKNDPSQTFPGAQVSLNGIQGDTYLFFDWAVSQTVSDPENYSYVRILESAESTVYFEKTFHNASMEKDQDSIRAYLKPGSTYTVEIGMHTDERAKDNYSLEIQNLKIGRYGPLVVEPLSSRDPLFDLLIAPVTVDPETGKDPNDNPNDYTGLNPFGPGPNHDTGDPPTRGSGTPTTGSTPGNGIGDNIGDAPKRGSGNANTGSGPGTGGDDFTDNAPSDPEGDPTGTDMPILPVVEPTFPGMIPTNPASQPGSDMGPAPVLIRSDDFPFTDPVESDPDSTGNAPTIQNVPDSTLGFLPLATLIGLLFMKALAGSASNPNRRRDP